MRTPQFALFLSMLLGCAKAGEPVGGSGAANGQGGATAAAPGVGGFGGLLSAGGDAFTAGGDTKNMHCNDLTVMFDKVVPTVVVLVDRSSSMSDSRYGTGTRWDVLKASLLDPVKGLLKPNQMDVRFGLVTFTSTATDAACPVLGKVDIGLNAYDAIAAYYSPLMTPAGKGETPTGESVRAVTDQLLQYAEPGPKYIVLATDGDPDTCPGTCTGNDCPVSQLPGYPRDPNCGEDESIAAVQAAFGKGIGTFVIGLGDDLHAEHLQALANAGRGLPVSLGSRAAYLRDTCRIATAALKGSYVATTAQNATAYAPSDDGALASDLVKIINSVRSCSFMLKGKVNLANASAGTVVLDGEKLSYMGDNGWRMNGQQELEVVGTACDRIRSDSHQIDISFPCGVYQPPPK